MMENGQVHGLDMWDPLDILLTIEEDGFGLRFVKLGIGYRSICRHMVLEESEVRRRMKKNTHIIGIR